MFLGSIAFGITYLLIASRRLRWIRIDRGSGAIIGAVLAVAIGSISPEEAATAVDQSTLVLLFAVMGMGAFLSIDGFFDPAEAIEGKLFTGKSVMTLAVLAGTVIAYIAGSPMTYTALTGFAILLILHRIDPTEVWARIDWSVLIFFGGLFVSVDGFVRSGAPAYVFGRLPLFIPPRG